MFFHSGFGNTMAHWGIHSQTVIISQYNYLIFPAVLSTEFLILVDSWETELSSRLSNTAWIHRGKEIKFDKWWPEGDCLHVSIFLMSCSLRCFSPPLGSRCASSELGAPDCQEHGGGAPPAYRWSLVPYWLKSQAGSSWSWGSHRTPDPPTGQRQGEM